MRTGIGTCCNNFYVYSLNEMENHAPDLSLLSTVLKNDCGKKIKTYIFSFSMKFVSFLNFIFIFFFFYSNRLADLLSILNLAVCSVDNIEGLRMGLLRGEGENSSR